MTEEVQKKDDAAVEPEIQKSKKPEPPKQVTEFMQMMMKQVSGPASMVLLEKMDKSHIDKVLDMADKQDERGYEFSKSGRRYNIFYCLLAVAVFIFITCYLTKTNIELYKKILEIGLSFGAGFGGGYGFRAYRSGKK